MKAHWRPLEPVSWPSSRGMRTFHTGYAAVCGRDNARFVERELALVACETCLRIAAKARYDRTGAPVQCMAHTDCRAHLDLGMACSAERARASLKESEGRRE